MAIRSVKYVFKKPPVTTKRATVIVIRAKTCTELLHMIPVRISSCAKSVLRYKYLILDTYHPDTLYLREQGLENPWLFFETKMGPRTKQFEKHRLYESDRLAIST